MIRVFGLAAYWLAPMLFCLALYWHGLNAWFRDDDFVWLRLRFDVGSWRDLSAALFTPTRHGTFRPLSERAYFLVFGSLFPMDALPFRMWAFLTQFASLTLVASVTRRLTGSRLAGFLAPVFWTANASLATAMCWNSAYMQILCGFCLLLAFHFLLRHIETGRWRYYWFQWAAFLTGFLAMETTLVYPALPAVYTLLFARRHFRSTLPLWAASAAFLIFHMAIVPKQTAGPYALHFDTALPATLAAYWRWAWEPYNLAALTGYPWWVAPLCDAFLTVALLGFTLWSLRKRDWLPVLCLAWFLILLAPVLPLREHRSSYYLTLPTLGLGMLLACAVAAAWRAAAVWRAVAVAGASFYLMVMVPGAFGAARWQHERSREAQALVLGVMHARQLHPTQAILLTGIDNRLFWSVVWDGGFAAAGVSDVYLDPATASRIQAEPGRENISESFLPEEVIAYALHRGGMVVYEVAGRRLKNITRRYAGGRETPPGPPRRVDVSSPLTEYALGPAWRAREARHRWMPRRATLRLGGPRSAAERLYVSGYCPAFLLAPGPLGMTVSADGEPLSTVSITRGDARFQFDFPLPARLAGRPEVELEIRLDRVSRAADGRELGLVFGVFEIR